MGTMRLVVLAAALAAVACAGGGDDGALLNFLRGGAQKITTSGRGSLDIGNGAEQQHRDETVTRTPQSAMKEMEPTMANEYDRPRVVSETVRSPRVEIMPPLRVRRRLLKKQRKSA